MAVQAVETKLIPTLNLQLMAYFFSMCGYLCTMRLSRNSSFHPRSRRGCSPSGCGGPSAPIRLPAIATAPRRGACPLARDRSADPHAPPAKTRPQAKLIAARDQGLIALTHALMERGSLCFHPIEQGIEARCGRLLIHVEDQR